MADKPKNLSPIDLLMDASVGPSTVSLLNLGSGLPRVFGSGTLIKCGSVQGILTCAHVYDAFFSQGTDIGVCAYPVSRGVFQRKSLNPTLLDGVRIPPTREPYSESGPDLAFINVPDIDMAAFSHVTTTIDLDLGKKKSPTTLEPNGKCIFVVAGAIEDLTDDPEIIDGKGVYIPEGRINVGKLNAQVEINGFDIVTFEPKLENPNDEPASYGATSGGGLWRLCLNEEGGAHSASVVGVAFYETAAPNRKLKCHGPRSVFEELVDEIHKKWP